MSADLRARLIALVAEWRQQFSSDIRAGRHQSGDAMRRCADELEAALRREPELASREAAEYPNQAGPAVGQGQPSGLVPALDALIATWRWPGRQHFCYPKDCAEQLARVVAPFHTEASGIARAAAPQEP